MLEIGQQQCAQGKLKADNKLAHVVNINSAFSIFSLVLGWKGRGHEKAVSITYYRPYLSLARSPNYNYLGEWTSKSGLSWPLAYASFHSSHGNSNSNMPYALMYCGNECCFCIRLPITQIQ